MAQGVKRRHAALASQVFGFQGSARLTLAPGRQQGGLSARARPLLGEGTAEFYLLALSLPSPGCR